MAAVCGFGAKGVTPPSAAWSSSTSPTVPPPLEPFLVADAVPDAFSNIKADFESQNTRL